VRHAIRRVARPEASPIAGNGMNEPQRR
jgi:hypothetical protein